MPKFDRINGQFVAVHCTFEEKDIFVRAGWNFDPTLKRWVTADIDKAMPLSVYAIGVAQVHLDTEVQLQRGAIDASWAEETDAEYPSPDGLAYFPFQKAGIEYALDGDDTLFADPPGLGKTIQAIGVHNTLACKRVLVICPASLKVNWQREWRRWDVHNRSVGIALSKARSKTRDGFTKTWVDHVWPETAVVIVNYDMLETFDDQVKGIDWDLLIVDEVHMLKGLKTVRTKCVFGGEVPSRKNAEGIKTRDKKYFTPVKATRRLFLTGTPIMSRPVDLWTIVKALDPEGLGKSYEKFTKRYCAGFKDERGRWDASGKSNLIELQRLLRTYFMVRRDKRSVLKELPDKLREIILLPYDQLNITIKKEKSRVDKALAQFEAVVGVDQAKKGFLFIDDLCAKIDRLIGEQDTEEKSWEDAINQLTEPESILFTEISSAREEVALAKVPLVVAHVKSLIDAGEPVIVFGYHKSVITALKKEFPGCSVVTGQTPPNKRQAQIDRFQDGETDVIIGNILAMGVGFTLTRARMVVFAELDWVPSLIEQAEDRAWRIGQVNAVLIQHLVVDGSIEARQAIVIVERMGTIYRALDSREGG